VLAALNTLNFQTTSLVAIIGAAGLAVGFALQGSLSNFASGIMLIIFRLIKINDLITAAGETGFVEEIGVFTTTIRTVENKIVIIPNAKLTGDNITNFTTKGTLRVDMKFGIGYGDDIDKARKAIKEVLDNDSRILKDPAPDIFVSELDDSSVNFTVNPGQKQEFTGVYTLIQLKQLKRNLMNKISLFLSHNEMFPVSKQLNLFFNSVFLLMIP